MSAPLISDATLATIVRALYACSSCENWEGTQTVLWLVCRERYAEALDHARGASHDPEAIAGVIEALEEANEEAARTHDAREAAANPPSRRWACPTCTSVFAVDRIAEVLAAQGARYVNVVRCLCGEVRP